MQPTGDKAERAANPFHVEVSLKNKITGSDVESFAELVHEVVSIVTTYTIVIFELIRRIDRFFCGQPNLLSYERLEFSRNFLLSRH